MNGNDKKITLKIVIVACVCAVMLIAAVGCAARNDPRTAATVNGEVITEQNVSDYIDGFRARMDLQEDDAWAEWLDTSGSSPEGEREKAIDYLVRCTVIEQDAASKGVTVTDEDVNRSLKSVEESYGCENEAALEGVLAVMDYTIDTYKDFLRQGLFQEGIVAKLAEQGEEVAWEDYVQDLISKSDVEKMEAPENLSYAIAVKVASSEDAGE